jgi:hypothetical protein
VNVEQATWSIKKLIDEKERIELTPVWQRGPAWKHPRQVLLVDSILRRMDIPKIYLRRLNQGAFTHDAVDGQQRLRAIWSFRAGDFALDYTEPLPLIEGENVNGKKFAQLSGKLRERFEDFPVSIGEITSSKIDDIRNMFARLQMGVSLNPAELRNAMGGPLRLSIDSTARLHPFFVNSRIPSDRYKHQDYAAHAYAVAAYDGEQDIKAPDLRLMFLSYGLDNAEELLELAAEVDGALEVLDQVNQLVGFTITQKWIFVDLFWVILQQTRADTAIDVARLTAKFARFEALRRTYNANPETLLIADGHPEIGAKPAQHLYNYIQAFKAQGGTQSSLQTRNRTIRAFCL